MIHSFKFDNLAPVLVCTHKDEDGYFVELFDVYYDQCTVCFEVDIQETFESESDALNRVNQILRAISLIEK